jgi:superfamily II DNA/RNA helicase
MSENEKTFFEYNLKNHLKKICQGLGYFKPSEIQKEVIEHILSHEEMNNYLNYIITSLAGSGKTFSYIMCLLNKFDFSLNKLQAIILLPTRELALQTVSYFEKINHLNEGEFKINYKLMVGGSAGINAPKKKEDNLFLNDEVQVIIGTLGKVHSTIKKSFNLEKKKKYSNSGLRDYIENMKFLIIDEADKLINQNSDGIYDKFLSLFFNKQKESNMSLILISASFDQKSMNFYLKYVNHLKVIQMKGKSELSPSCNIEDSSNNIKNESTLKLPSDSFVHNYIKEYYYIFKPQVKVTYFEQKYEVLFSILNTLSKDFKQCLIFYNQKGRGEELAADLREAGWPTTFIHGDLTQDQRILIYDKIRQVQVKVILATDLFSRGIDLSTVDLVLNFDSAYNETDYFHRVGRTGRYNSYGISISFFQENEEKILEAIKLKDKSEKLIQVREFNEETLEKFRQDLMNVKNCNKINEDLKTKILELENNITHTTDSNEKFSSKKRRRELYRNESLISNWVEVDEDLYDQSKFKYLDKDKEKENVTQKKCDFCLYCNLFKIFEQGVIDTNK